MENETDKSSSFQHVASSIPPWKQVSPQTIGSEEVIQQEPKIASLIYRYAASMIDGLALALMLSPVLIPLFMLGQDEESNIVNLIAAVASIIYSVYFISKFQATWGKMFFKLKVKTTDNKEMTAGRAVKREVLGKIVSGIVFGLGYVWALFDPKRQAWHDKIAGTVVVQTEPLSRARKFAGFFLAFGVVFLAILGVLAVVILVAIDPQGQLDRARRQQVETEERLQDNGQNDSVVTEGLSEQMLRARDAARISSVVMLGRAIDAYYVSHNGSYPVDGTWVTDLVESEEIAKIPDSVTYEMGTDACSEGLMPYQGWCYKTNAGSDAIVYSSLESFKYNSQCDERQAYVFFSSSDGRGGIVCGINEPDAGSGFSFIDF